MKLFLYRLYSKLSNFICNLFAADDLRNGKTSHTYNKVTILSSQFVKEKASLYHYEEGYRPPWITIFEAGFLSPEIWYVQFDKAYLISKGLLLNQDKIIFLESAFQKEYLYKLYAAPLLVKTLFVKPQKRLSHIIPLMNQLSNNYWHWTAESLTRMALLLQHDESIRENYSIVINDSAPGFVEESLHQILHWPKEKIIRFGAKETAIVEDCIQISYPNLRNADTGMFNAFPPYIFKVLNSLAFKNIQAGQIDLPPHFILSRKNSTYRNLLNEDELMNALLPYGLVSVQVEKLSFAQQVGLFQQAKLIIAPHGAGLTNITYCHADTVVIELYPIGRNFNQTSSFHQISKAIGIHMYKLMVHPVNKHEDMLIDEVHIQKIIAIFKNFNGEKN